MIARRYGRHPGTLPPVPPAASKSYTAFTWATGSATSSGTTDPISCASDYVDDLSVSIAQGGPPGTPASFSPQWSPDGSTFYAGPTYSAPTAEGTSYWSIEVPVTVQAVRIVYTAASADGSSVLRAQLGAVTGMRVG